MSTSCEYCRWRTYFRRCLGDSFSQFNHLFRSLLDGPNREFARYDRPVHKIKRAPFVRTRHLQVQSSVYTEINAVNAKPEE